MTTAEIIGLVSAIAAAVAAIFSAIACFLSYRFTKPRVKVDFEIAPKRSFYVCFQKLTGEIVRTACLIARIYNSSAVGGTVARISFCHKGKTYHAEPIGSNLDLDWLTFSESKPLKQDFKSFRTKLPFPVPAFSATMAVFFFEDFPVTSELAFPATVEVVCVDSHLKTERKKVIFYDRLRAAGDYRYYHADQTDTGN